ncbi:RICIN domain-containing protein [Paenibacillus sp. GCM10012307]|uniref:RICIN domain-containing protein n=1 Tax=Paenibacillus roseus TaxID=2798579 RepID=A0A934J4L3_9BACL|nr:RICIN domain-containing protein [Paenibacillus roseus]MBJ6363179.1 RICIN domain-containing protein [Paenibacillus roseus]
MLRFYRKAWQYLIIFTLLFTTVVTVDTAQKAHAADPAPNWQLIDPKYPTTDTIVAAYNVKDFGATGDGVTDVTAIFQNLLDSLDRLGGGTLFVPEGKYVIRGNLEIPKGITIRGEWNKPVKGQPIQGTILMAYAGRGNENATPFITMVTSSAVMDLSIWYPEQLPNSITAYPPTILIGKPNYFGNEYANVKNVTLVNAYSGIIFSRQNGGAGPVINGVYGTPLSRGIEFDNIVDIGRIDWVDFAPEYWSGSGLTNAPAPNGAFKQWIYNNGTGIVMRRNDWSYTTNVTIDGYNVGYLGGPSVTTPGSDPNGHHYNLNFIRNKTAIKFDSVNEVGIMFTKVTIDQSESGIVVGPNTKGVVQLSASSINAVNAIAVDATSRVRISMQQGTVAAGTVQINGGTFTASNSDFNNAAPQVVLGTEARGILVGNRFANPVNIANNSRYATHIDHTATTVKPLPILPEIKPETRKPSRKALYIVTNAPFNAVGNGTTDNTAAIQNALNQAGTDGGGVVFLPPGKYKVLGNLTIPSGVELKGSSDVSTVPTGQGSTLEVYAGRGSATGTPFLSVSANSGVRGLTFNYPEQDASVSLNVSPYPYMIRATGSNAYIVNVGMRAAYNGVDLFTNRTDNHYVDSLAGHAFKNAIRIGGGAVNGTVKNLQFNVLAFAVGRESKFGSWPNSPIGDNSPVYAYAANNLDFMILGDVVNQTLFNDFHYGSARGLVTVNENGRGPTGTSLGLGIDGATKAIVFESMGTGGFNFINTQIVSIGDSATTRYLETGPNFSGETTFFSVDLWGHPKYGVDINAGTIAIQLGNFENAGSQGFSLLNSGQLKLDTTVVGNTPAFANAGKEAQLYIQSSLLNPAGLIVGNTALWKNNLTLEPTATAPLVSYISLKAVVNNQFVSAGSGGASALTANKSTVGLSEQFKVVDAGSGLIALQSTANNKYVTAGNGGANSLIASSTSIGSEERFQWVSNSDGTISLLASVNSKYVAAENGGAAALIANRTAIGLWEKFQVNSISLVDSGVYRITAKHSGKVMDVKDLSTADGAAIQQWSWGSSNNQRWRLNSVGNGYYSLTAVSSNKALEVSGASTSSGAALQQRTYSGATNQQWLIEDAGGNYFRIVARHSGKVVDVSGVSQSDGAILHQWDWLNADNQKWSFELQP